MTLTLRRLARHAAVVLGTVAAIGSTPAVLAGLVYPDATAPPVAIEQHLGAQLPLDAHFVDATGHPVRLGDYFATKVTTRRVPVVLILGYYHCPDLCETVMQGALEALAASGLGRGAYRVLAVSIDPAETPADASERRRRDLEYADLAAARFGLGRAPEAPLMLDALVGDAASIALLAHQAGFVFTPADSARTGTGGAPFAHASGFLVATPEGRVSRYFLGVRHDAEALRDAVEVASDEAIGSWVDRLVLVCAHLDPTLGRRDAPVLLVVRIIAIASALGLAGWIWRFRRRGDRDEAAP